MVKIELSNGKFWLNANSLNFPIGVDKLQEILGVARLTITKYNSIYTWDNLGILAYCKDGKAAQNLLICLCKDEFEFSSKSIFSGEILIDGKDAISYYNANPKMRTKLFYGDRGGAIISGEIKFWFSKGGLNDTQAIEIGTLNDENKEYIKLKDTKNFKPKVEAKFSYLTPLWQEWVAQVQTIVPEYNRYYNLICGINEIKSGQVNLTKNAKIPDELINFYKIYNVEYNAVASAFCFNVSDSQYALIAFDDIKMEYQNTRDFLRQNSGQIAKIGLKFSGYSDKFLVPFAHNYLGDYLLYDANLGEFGVLGRILEMVNENGELKIVANSLNELMINEINGLKSGKMAAKFDFILKNG